MARFSLLQKPGSLGSVRYTLNPHLRPLLPFFLSVEYKETLRHLASVYANNHPTMQLGQPGCPNKSGTCLQR